MLFLNNIIKIFIAITGIQFTPVKWYLIIFITCFYSYSTFAQTPIIYLPLDGNTLDISGNNLNGINSNATLTTDRFNNPNSAYSFNGSNASIAIPYSNKFNILPGGKFTISLWLQPALANSVCALFVKSPYHSNYFLSQWDYGLYLLTNKGMSGYANTNFLVGTTTMIQNACWYHLAVTYDNGNWNLYLNGKLEAWDYSMTKKILQSGGGISLGKKGEADGDFYNGKLDDVRFYDIALTPAELKKIVCFADTDKQISCGDSVQLNGQGIGTPLWSPVTGLSNPNILNPKAAPGSNQTYILSLSNGGTCIVRDTVLVSVTNANINLGPDQLICEGDSFVFSNTAPGSYVWSPVYAISNNKIPNPTVRPLVPVNYYVTVTNGSCVSRDTIHFDIINVNANAGADQSICAGDSVQLNGSAVGFYNWSPITNISNPAILNPIVFPQLTTAYILTSTATTCTKRDTVLITVISQVPAFAGNDVSICLGSSVQLNGSYGAGANNGLWLSNYAISDPTLSNPIVSPLVDTSYIFRAGFGNSCYGYDTMLVSVISYPTVNAGPDIHYCFNSLGQINASIINYDSFYWKPITGLFNSQALATAVSGNINTKYILVGSNKGCESRDSLYLLVQPKVLAQFKATPPVTIAPAQIQFNNQSQNSFFYSWNFGDGTLGSETNPIHAYNKTGIYTIRLIASDSLGCTDSTVFDINIINSPYLFLPNAFTPNSDDNNDFFGVIYNPDAFKFLKYTIYNRWGELLFQTLVPGGKWWDGSYNGALCQADVYVYVLEAEDLTGKTYALSGNVTLLR